MCSKNEPNDSCLKKMTNSILLQYISNKSKVSNQYHYFSGNAIFLSQSFAKTTHYLFSQHICTFLRNVYFFLCIVRNAISLGVSYNIVFFLNYHNPELSIHYYIMLSSVANINDLETIQSIAYIIQIIKFIICRQYRISIYWSLTRSIDIFSRCIFHNNILLSVCSNFNI